MNFVKSVILLLDPAALYPEEIDELDGEISRKTKIYLTWEKFKWKSLYIFLLYFFFSLNVICMKIIKFYC